MASDPRKRVVALDADAPEAAVWLAHGVRATPEDEAPPFPASAAAPDRLVGPAAASARAREAVDACGRGRRPHDLRQLHVSARLMGLSVAEVSRKAGLANPAAGSRLNAHALPDPEERRAVAVDARLVRRR